MKWADPVEGDHGDNPVFHGRVTRCVQDGRILSQIGTRATVGALPAQRTMC